MLPPIEEGILDAYKRGRCLLWVCYRYDFISDSETVVYNFPFVHDPSLYRSKPNRQDNALAALHWEAIWLEGAGSPLLKAFQEGKRRAKAPGRDILEIRSTTDWPEQEAVEGRLPFFCLSPPQSEANTGGGALGVDEELAAVLKEYPGRLLVVLGARYENDLMLLRRTVEKLENTPLHVILLCEDAALASGFPANGPVQMEAWQATPQVLVKLLKNTSSPLASVRPIPASEPERRRLPPKEEKHPIQSQAPMEAFEFFPGAPPAVSQAIEKPGKAAQSLQGGTPVAAEALPAPLPPVGAEVRRFEAPGPRKKKRIAWSGTFWGATPSNIQVLRNWHHFFENLQASSQSFYEEIEAELEARKLPKTATHRVALKERGLFSDRREYLRVRRDELILDICCAPFGKGFFVSWWMGEYVTFFWRLVMIIPFIGERIYRSFNPITYYRVDTALMLEYSVRDSVLAVINPILEAKGWRTLNVDEIKPVFDKLFRF